MKYGLLMVFAVLAVAAVAFGCVTGGDANAGQSATNATPSALPGTQQALQAGQQQQQSQQQAGGQQNPAGAGASPNPAMRQRQMPNYSGNQTNPLTEACIGKNEGDACTIQLPTPVRPPNLSGNFTPRNHAGFTNGSNGFNGTPRSGGMFGGGYNGTINGNCRAVQGKLMCIPGRARPAPSPSPTANATNQS